MSPVHLKTNGQTSSVCVCYLTIWPSEMHDSWHSLVELRGVSIEMFYLKKTWTSVFPLRGQRLVLLLIAVGVLLLLILNTYNQEIRKLRVQLTGDSAYWSEEVREETLAIEDVFRAKFKPPPGRSIFFHETKPLPADSKYYMLNFTERQACAIESAALHHPDYQVFVLFAKPEVKPRSDPIIDAILSYKNVHFRRVDLMSIAEGTPIEEWLKKGKLVGDRLELEYIL